VYGDNIRWITAGGQICTFTHNARTAAPRATATGPATRSETTLRTDPAMPESAVAKGMAASGVGALVTGLATVALGALIRDRD
jgi:hypothetical protein